MADDTRLILKDASSRNAGIVLSLPGVGALCHHKSRFLAEEESGFWVEGVPSERATVEKLIPAGQSVGVSFKQGINKIIFAAPIRNYDPAFRINAETTVEALFVEFPLAVKSIQRRNNYRVSVSEGSGLTARIWRIGPAVHLKDRPQDAQEIACEVRDVSLGGMGVVFRGKDGKPPRVTPDDRLRIEFQFNELSLLMEGQMRPPTGDGKGTADLRTGVFFKQLEQDMEGRKIIAQLTRIVGELHRDEVRRHRRGLLKSA